MADAKGRRCPQVEHACRTFEGEAVWRAVGRAGGWTGGGMVPRRVDRAAVRARMPDVPIWILEELIDAFEPAALAASAKVEGRRKPKPPSPTPSSARRAPSARAQE